MVRELLNWTFSPQMCIILQVKMCLVFGRKSLFSMK